MSILSGKRILLGISGGIAAYKTPLLVRFLKKKGAQVQVVMTPAAKDFVTPLSLSTVSERPVHSSFVEKDAEDNPRWNNHVDLALWADLMIIAPATSNTLSAMAQAVCNNILLASYLSSTCPVYVAPAMDLDMYAHPANQKNLQTLQENGVRLLDAEVGFLASGLEGKGRMMEPETIVAQLESDFEKAAPFYQKTVVITAGPTYEAIDPVRFIGNHSTGKMGYALAEKAAQLGAKVILISGPSALDPQHTAIEKVAVVSAEEMYNAATAVFAKADVFIAAAAVADFKPKEKASQKLKKDQGLEHIALVPTQDILAHLGKEKDKQYLVGFALETENEIENAKGKIRRKNLDAIVLNSLNDDQAGFGGDKNKITYIDKTGDTYAFPLKAKSEVAADILEQILNGLENTP